MKGEVVEKTLDAARLIVLDSLTPDFQHLLHISSFLLSTVDSSQTFLRAQGGCPTGVAMIFK